MVNESDGGGCNYWRAEQACITPQHPRPRDPEDQQVVYQQRPPPEAADRAADGPSSGSSEEEASGDGGRSRKRSSPGGRPSDRVAGDFCLMTRQHIMDDSLLERVAGDFNEMLSSCGGKFTEVRRRQYAAGGVHDLGTRVYIVPEEHYHQMAAVMSPRSNGANCAVIHSTAIEWFEDLMMALARGAWDIFYTQWVETVRFDEGDEAADELVRHLEQLDLGSVERKARVLTHQLASLTLLAYSKSLAEHKDAPMFGHTIGAITIAGEGQLTIRPASSPDAIELTQSRGDFYSFCCSYRDDATHAAAVTTPQSPPPDAAASTSSSSSPPPPPPPDGSGSSSSSNNKRCRLSPSATRKQKKRRWALLVRMWLPGRIRCVRMKGEKCQFKGYRRLGSSRMDSDEETKHAAFEGLQLSEDDPAWAKPDYTSLRTVMVQEERSLI